MSATTPMSLRALIDQPFALLREMERRATARYTTESDSTAWVGVGLKIAGQRYVVARDDIREVMKRPELTRIPGAKDWLLGLANVRGQLLPLVDLSVLMDEAPLPTDRRTRVVIANNDDVPMGVVVSEVYGFRRFTDGDRVDAGYDGVALSEFIDGGFRRDGASWPILSFAKVVASSRLLSAV